MSKWVVNIKGNYGENTFEISVLLDHNYIGKTSYGWFGPSKLLISHNGGSCHWPVTKEVWDALVMVAHSEAARRNNEESRDITNAIQAGELAQKKERSRAKKFSFCIECKSPSFWELAKEVSDVSTSGTLPDGNRIGAPTSVWLEDLLDRYGNMPGLCPLCVNYLHSCTRPGVSHCLDFSPIKE